MKIKELVVGNSYTLPLVMQVGAARTTKTNKPYLAMTLFDGTESISGNYWDWGGKSIPPSNKVLDVTCQVTEWQGTKQLTVKGIVINNDLEIEAFMPKPEFDTAGVYRQVKDLIATVEDGFLRNLTDLMYDVLENLWKEIPGAKAVHHAYVGGTMYHSLSVAKTARAIAEQTQGANVDLCIVGALLHDLGKLFTYKMEFTNISMTDEGMLFDHTYMGTEFISKHANKVAQVYGDEFHIDVRSNREKLDLLKHIILSHHGELEYGAAVQPLCIEAIIVHNADKIDASAEMIRQASIKADGAKWTAPIWALGNRGHISAMYVRGLMEGDDD